MPSSKPRRPVRPRSLVVLVSVSALLASALAAVPANASDETGHGLDRQAFRSRLSQTGRLSQHSESSPSATLTGRGVDGDLATVRGPVAVMLELDATPAIRVYTARKPAGRRQARVAERDQRLVVREQASEVARRFDNPTTRARELYRVSTVYSGVAVRTDASRIGPLSRIPGVKAVHRLTPKTTTNSTSVPLIGAPAAWGGRDDTGEGVTIAVIDTGIDYTHADFGGPGTPAAYDDAHASAEGPGATFTPTAKVVDGYDFAGDAYNADPADPGFDPVPRPDANPLDCAGHGTHVAGTAAGLGVTAGGTTYAGDYDQPIDPEDLSIGPGVAPGASLVALRIFGCSGSTELLTLALDKVAELHVDVVNMSLGGGYGSPEDPDAVASNNLSAAGTTVVASMGNSGDIYEVGGSPGNAARVLAVAATDDGNDVVDGLVVTHPAGIEPADTVDGKQDDVFAAQRSVAYDWAHDPGLTDQPVALVGDWDTAPSAANNTDGCDTYSPADAAAINGAVVLQSWTDGPDRRCGSATRAANAVQAGAAGVIYGDDQDTFASGVTGSAVVPAMITIRQATDAMTAALADGAGLRVTMSNDQRNRVRISNPGAVDTLAAFSSRGIGVANSIKPDVAAPGVTTFSANVATGNEGIAESGTSMAAPHVAGEAALVRAAHPSWDPEQVKAAIVNTAGEDVYVGQGHTGDTFGPERVGAGRVRADDAVATSVLAYVKGNPGSVGVSFGPFGAHGLSTRSKLVTVQNTGAAEATYAATYQATNATPGVSYQASPSSVTVPAGKSTTVKVTLVVDARQLRHTQDPTTVSDPLGIGLQRSFRTDASGRLVLTPSVGTPGPALRVPVWSAPRPASAMTQAPSVSVSGRGLLQRGTLPLRGSDVFQGRGTGTYASTVSGFQLQLRSPRLPACTATVTVSCVSTPDDRSVDLRYVGSASDAPVYTDAGLDPFAPYADDPGCATSGSDDCFIPPALLSFGITAWGPWRTPSGNTEYDILLDGDGDGIPDAGTYNSRLMSETDDYDHFVATTVDLREATYGDLIDQELVNLTDGSFESGLFNSDSMVMSVSLHSLKDAGIITRGFPVAYQVAGYSLSGALSDGDTAPESRWKQVHLLSPGLMATGDSGFPTLNSDAPGLVMDVRRDTQTVRLDAPSGLLLIHHLNGNGSRGQAVKARSATTTNLAASRLRVRKGKRLSLTSTVLTRGQAPQPGGRVVFKNNGRRLGSARLVNGKVSLSTTRLKRGRHRMVAVYRGDAFNAPSRSRVLVLTVTPR